MSKKIDVAKSIQAELDKLNTKSSKIRYLSANNYTRSQIANILDIRYQHVRNVLVNPPKNKTI